jgi:hypothetical protein
MLATSQSKTFCLLVSCRKTENWNIQDYNIACGPVWMWNFVSDINGGRQTVGV